MPSPLTESDLAQGTVTTQGILEELDHAIADHIGWLKAWHRSLVCAEEPLPADLAYDPHHLCRFGSWYVRHQHSGLVNQPVLRKLAGLHRDMHDRGRDLMEAARRGGPPARPSYDAFMDSVAAFFAQARRLEKAFAKASSDLDPLTGLHNRQAMLRDLEREWQRAARSEAPWCIGIGDLDRFKGVNDTYGHAAGDRVLAAAAARFLDGLRPYDSVYRYGGEEFLFCLPEADLKVGHVVLDRLREALEAQPVRLETGEVLPVTGSFGVAQVSARAPVEEAMERADQALYWAKSRGRNRVCAWDGPQSVENMATDDPPA